MILSWSVYLTLDQINAVCLLIEQEGIADEDLEGAYRELENARDTAIRREASRIRYDHWNETPEAMGLKPREPE